MATRRSSAPDLPSGKSTTPSKPRKKTKVSSKTKAAGPVKEKPGDKRSPGKAAPREPRKPPVDARQVAESDSSDEQAMIDRWNQRARDLEALFARLGAAGLSFAADLKLGRCWLQSADGRPRVVASARVLLSYSHTAGSILCGWANPVLPRGSTIEPVEGIEDRYEGILENVAWGLAMRLAEKADAHHIYRVSGGPATIFLALWDVRAAGDDDAPFVPRSPWPHVEEVLTGLLARVAENEPVDALLETFGGTFEKDEARKGTSFSAPLREIGQRLSALAGLSPARQRSALKKLLEEVKQKQRA